MVLSGLRAGGWTMTTTVMMMMGMMIMMVVVVVVAVLFCRGNYCPVLDILVYHLPRRDVAISSLHSSSSFFPSIFCLASPYPSSSALTLSNQTLLCCLFLLLSSYLISPSPHPLLPLLLTPHPPFSLFPLSISISPSFSSSSCSSSSSFVPPRPPLSYSFSPTPRT